MDYWIVALEPELTVCAAFDADLGLIASDFVILAEARVEAEQGVARSAAEAFDTAIAELTLFNVIRMQQFAADKALLTRGMHFRTEADEATFREWVASTIVALDEVSERSAAALNHQSDTALKAAVRMTETAMAPLFGKLPQLKSEMSQGLPRWPGDSPGIRISDPDD